MYKKIKYGPFYSYIIRPLKPHKILNIRTNESTENQEWLTLVLKSHWPACFITIPALPTHCWLPGSGVSAGMVEKRAGLWLLRTSVSHPCHVEKQWQRTTHAEKLKKDYFSLSYNKNLTQLMSDVCIGSLVSDAAAAVQDELFLAWGKVWLQGHLSMAVSQQIRQSIPRPPPLHRSLHRQDVCWMCGGWFSLPDWDLHSLVSWSKRSSSM